MRIISPCKTQIIDLKNYGDIYIKEVSEKFGIHFKLDDNKTAIALYKTEKQAKFVFNKIASLINEKDKWLELPSEENLYYVCEEYRRDENKKILTAKIDGEIIPIVNSDDCVPCGEILLNDWWWKDASEFRDLFKEEQP